MKNRYIILALLSVLLYLPSVFGGFMWDDEDIILGDPAIHGLAGAAALFSADYWKRDFSGAESRYRPARAVLLALEWQVFGKDPAGYHAVNLVLNAAAACLAFWLSLLVLKDPGKAFIAALFFALHPVHVESVAWIKNMSDILMFLFAALAAGLFIRAEEGGGKFSWPALLLFVPALLSKENAAVLPALLAAWLALARGERPLAALKKTLPFWLAAAALLAFAVFALRRGTMPAGFDPLHALGAFAQYSRLLFLPFDLSAERYLVTAFDAAGPVAILLLWRRFYRAGDKAGLFALAWLVIGILPFLDIRLLSGRPIAEQRLYTAALGAGLAAGTFYTPFPAWRRYALYVFLGVFAVFSAARNFDWLDPVRLWEKTVLSAPFSARAHSNLGLAYERAGRLNEAARSYSAAAGLEPEEEKPALNLAALLYSVGRSTEAAAVYGAALRRDPESREAALGLARLKAEAGEAAAAERLLLGLLEKRPADADARVSLGAVYARTGRFDEAEKALAAVLAAEPAHAAALYNLARLYFARGRAPEAAAAYERLLAAEPAHADALNNLAILKDMAGDEAAAIELFGKAAAAPGYYQASYNLGGIYFRKKMYVEALSEYTRVLAANPAHRGAALKAAEIRKLLGENTGK